MKKNPNTDTWINEFASGNAHNAYEILGAHSSGRKQTTFRVWAPEAVSVSVVGDFNSWDHTAHPMERVKGGIWELEIPNLESGALYKYAIRARDGQLLWKADPYAFSQEPRPGTASRLLHEKDFAWSDQAWMESRRSRLVYSSPTNIYEVHLGSWRRKSNGAFLSYRELAKTLIPYVKSLGFTHIELMPIVEHPYDGSWGYQGTGYFAATSRYGKPEDLKYFINDCHKNKLGVIMDWTPAHFPKDPHGLVEFDGSRCYEYQDHRQGEHPSWGTRIFDFGKGEVRSFLISSALFWLREFHMDGIRVDAVASVLYLDYDREPGQWTPNKKGGRENLEAVEFLGKLNQAAFGYDTSILMIAEESTSWPLVTSPVELGGLGFNLKWNMGWMNDSLDYIKTDPLFRAGKHRSLSFSLFYAFSENFVLPLSHDEVVHMKGSLLNKMPGNQAEKLAGVRTFWSYMLAHPGKKLLFMGSELGQAAEWDVDAQLDWGCLENPGKSALHAFFRESNRFYKRNPTLWELDFDQKGFSWICPDEKERNIIAFTRRSAAGRELLFACSFSGASSGPFCLGLPSHSEYEIVFSTDDTRFGGTGVLAQGSIIRARAIPAHGREFSAEIDIPPLTAVFLRHRRKISPGLPGKQHDKGGSL